jgi:hypothetical protein
MFILLPAIHCTGNSNMSVHQITDYSLLSAQSVHSIDSIFFQEHIFLHFRGPSDMLPPMRDRKKNKTVIIGGFYVTKN